MLSFLLLIDIGVNLTGAFSWNISLLILPIEAVLLLH